MRTNTELQKELVNLTQNYRDTVPIFRLRSTDAAEMHRESLKLAAPFINSYSENEMRYDACLKGAFTHIQMQENATMQYYHASGYKQFQKNTNPFTSIVADDAANVKKEGLENNACSILEKSGLNISGAFETLKFEKLWQLKASGMSQEGIAGKTIINRLVYAYRRFVLDLPVLGCASVHIKTAADNELDAFGMDWRKIAEDPFTKASIISPEDAALRALEQLQNINPEKVFTLKDFQPEYFSLGYFSHSKSNSQSFLQPVYVARFISNGFNKMGHIIAVSATGTPYESICRKVTPPPVNAKRIPGNKEGYSNTPGIYTRNNYAPKAGNSVKGC
jgi:hypothetical protein